MFAERLMKCCAEKGILQKDLAAILETTPSVISGWKKGASPNSQFVISAAKFLGVSTDYLLGLSDVPTPTGDGQHYLLDKQEAELVQNLRNSHETTRASAYRLVSAVLLDQPVQPSNVVSFSTNDRLPIRSREGRRADRHRKDVAGDAAAGVPITNVPIDDLSVMVPAKYMGEEYFLVRAIGDSMTGAGINSGDICIFQSDAYRDSGKIMYVQVEGATDQPDGTIKRVFYRGREVELCSENPSYEPMFYPADQVSLNGVLVHVVPGSEVDE